MPIRDVVALTNMLCSPLDPRMGIVMFVMKPSVDTKDTVEHSLIRHFLHPPGPGGHLIDVPRYVAQIMKKHGIHTIERGMGYAEDGRIRLAGDKGLS